MTNDYKFGSVKYSLKLLTAIDPMDPELDKIKSIESVQVKAWRPETQRGLRRKSVEGN